MGVLLRSYNDSYISIFRKSLEDIQKKNPDKVKFTYSDSSSMITNSFRNCFGEIFLEALKSLIK